MSSIETYEKEITFHPKRRKSIRLFQATNVAFYGIY